MSNIISQFFNSPSDMSFTDDSDLLDLASNSVITNKTSNEKFKKIDTNVFNKTTIPSDTVLYDTVQQLTDSQKQRARNNIEALGSVEVQDLLESLTDYSTSSDYAKIINIGNIQVIYGYTYSPSQGEPKRVSRSMIAEFGGYFDEMPVMISSHVLGWTHGGNQNAQGVIRNSMSPGYGFLCYYDGNQLECSSYVALGKPFRQNHKPLSYHFTSSVGTYTASLQDVKTNSTIILEMYARSGSQVPSIEVDKSESFGFRDRTSTSGTLHRYGWRDNKIKVSGDVYDYSVVRTEDGQFKITGSQQNEDSLSKYRKIVYRLEAINSNVSLKFTKTGDQDGYIVLRYSVNDPSNDSGDFDIPEDPDDFDIPEDQTTWGLTQFDTFTIEANPRSTEARKTVGQSVSEGMIVREFHISRTEQTSSSSYLTKTFCYYVWKANGYTLTEEDKTRINSLTREYSSPYRVSYDSGTV